MTIKETAGKMLLYFYQLQRTVPLTMKHRQLGFIDKKDNGIALTSDKKWMTKDLTDINPVGNDVLNAFTFLLDKGFVQSTERTSASTRIYIGVQLTAKGIDIVEGVEDGHNGKQNFATTFNIQAESSASVDGLIKDTLGALLK